MSATTHEPGTADRMIDPAELRDWTREVDRARRDYAAHPIVSLPLCESCGLRSTWQLCPRCREDDA